ncbi:MAG: acyl-CoA thioesterase [Myxococcota bacterium]
MSSIRARVEFEVPFHDCDPLQIVWHGRYFEYFELARTQLFRERQLDIPAVRDLGLRMYVADVRCRFTSPLTYGDRVEVVAIAKEASPLIRIAYAVRNLTKDRRSARGHCVLATTDAQGELLTETPEIIRERLLG